MRFVELKSEEQLDMQTLHRARDRLVGERTALINQLRAVRLERGIAIPKGRRKLEQRLAVMMGEEEGGGVLGARIHILIDDMRMEWAELDRRITAFDGELAARARSDEAARRWRRSRALACSTRPLWSRRSEMVQLSHAVGTWRRGSG